MSEMKVEKREEKIKAWFSNPYNAMLVLVVLLAFALRIFFYIQTQGQTLWWDEAEYMSAAKKWAFDVPYELNPQRPPLFQAFSALLFFLGFGESAIKLLLVIIPAVFFVYSVFLLGKEMYNERIGIIAALFAAFSWNLLFWSVRVQPDFLSMSFQVLAICFMWKFWKKRDTNSVLLSGFFVALAFYFKISALLVPMVFILFILIKDRLSAIKDKHYYYFSASFLGTLIPYFIWAFITFGSPFAFRKGYVDAHAQFPMDWGNLDYYYILTGGLTFFLFIVGVIVALRFVFYLDILVKNKEKCFNPNIFGILVFIFVSCYYIFYQRGGTNDRWVFLWLPFIFFFVAQTIDFIYKSLSKKNNVLAVGITLIIIVLCAYGQLNHASQIIDIKKDSYSPVKEASLWMKQNTIDGDKIFSVSYTQAVYYTERNVTTYSMTPQLPDASAFDKMIIEHKPKYIMWSIFEMHPSYVETWMNGHLSKKDINVAYVMFADAEQTQPALIIFEPYYDKFG